MFGNVPKLTLGRVMGLPVRVDTTFLLVPFALFVALPGHLQEAQFLAAAVGMAGVFLSILAHEVGHALMARRQQVGVAEIVVGGFFGYAALKRQPIPRSALIRILVAGPSANLAVFLLLWLALAAGTPGAADFGQEVYQYRQSLDWSGEVLRLLAVVNLAMFVFNMIPAYPLDGGKILGLLLDRRLPQRRSLQIVAVLSILAGCFMVLLGLGLSLFLSFIGIMIIGTNLRRLRRLPQ